MFVNISKCIHMSIYIYMDAYRVYVPLFVLAMQVVTTPSRAYRTQVVRRKPFVYKSLSICYGLLNKECDEVWAKTIDPNTLKPNT